MTSFLPLPPILPFFLINSPFFLLHSCPSPPTPSSSFLFRHSSSSIRIQSPFLLIPSSSPILPSSIPPSSSPILPFSPSPLTSSICPPPFFVSPQKAGGFLPFSERGGGPFFLPFSEPAGRSRQPQIGSHLRVDRHIGTPIIKCRAMFVCNRKMCQEEGRKEGRGKDVCLCDDGVGGHEAMGKARDRPTPSQHHGKRGPKGRMTRHTGMIRRMTPESSALANTSKLDFAHFFVIFA